MADNLTPQQLAEIRRLFSTPVEQGNGNAYMPENVFYNGRNYDKQDTGYLGYDLSPTDFSYAGNESRFNGQGYDQYGQDGTFTNSGQFTGISDSNKAGDFLTGAAMMAPAFAAGIFPGVNSALSFGTNPVTGAGGGYGIVGGATEPVASMGAGGSGGTSVMGAGAGGGTYGTMAPLETMPMPAGVSGAAGLSTIGGVGGAGGLLGNALGVGASLLGAAAGAQGQKGESTTKRSITPELMPFLTGNNNALWEQTAGLLNKQMAPGYMQGYDDMRTKGMGLLNQPSMGNGFNRFFPGVK